MRHNLGEQKPCIIVVVRDEQLLQPIDGIKKRPRDSYVEADPGPKLASCRPSPEAQRLQLRHASTKLLEQVLGTAGAEIEAAQAAPVHAVRPYFAVFTAEVVGWVVLEFELLEG